MLYVGWFMVLISVSGLVGREPLGHEGELCFVAPGDVVFVATAYQPSCPIQFVSAFYVAFLDGGGRDVYTIRNSGTRAIKGYTIAILDSEGTGSEDSILISRHAYYVSPGQVLPRSSRDKNLRIVPLTEDLREKYMKSEIRVVKIFMVVRIDFADGSVYDAGPEYQALKLFFEKNSAHNDVRQQEKRK